MIRLLVTLWLLATPAIATAAGGPNSSRVDALLGQMTLDEKISMLHANEKFYAGGIERLGIPKILMSDGPHGVRGDVRPHSWESANRPEDRCTYLPVGTVLSATWSPSLGRRFGETLGAEARARGKDIILGPGINILRTPLCGRNFEYQSEDPFLISRMVVPIVEGIQAYDVAACVKHFAANNQELNRFYVDVEMSERALREIYLPGFEAAIVEADARSVMCAYNRFRGNPCSQSPDLGKRVLRDEWRSDTVFITDWHIHGIETVAAAMNGLDIEMGSPLPYDRYAMATPLLEAVRAGVVPEDVIDDKVRRILRMMFETNMLGDNARHPGAFNTPEHQRAAADIAREGMILLKNEGVLPLDMSRVRDLVVVGINADRAHHAGGGSSTVPALYEITPLQGLRDAFGDRTRIRDFPGTSNEARGQITPIPADAINSRDPGAGVPAWRGEYFPNKDLAGDAVIRYDAAVDFDVAVGSRPQGIGLTDCSARWTGTIVAPETGTYLFRLGSDDGSRLIVDGEVIAEMWWDHAYEIREAEISLVAGEAYELVVEFYQGGGDGKVQLGWRPPSDAPADDPLDSEMLDAVREADAVIYVGGMDKSHDNEGADRTTMTLPYEQDALIDRLLGVRPDTAIFMVAGSPIEMPWLDRAKALVWVGYAGMEAGSVLAELVDGRTNPSGKLPFTMPARLEDTPAHSIGDYAPDRTVYWEEVFVGYRWTQRHGITPLFPFGHGLSYTTFRIDDLRAPATYKPGGLFELSVRVTNTGKTHGAEVVQLYVHDHEASVARPAKELKGFAKVGLAPGESQRVSIVLDDRSFAFWDEQADGWNVEPGSFTLMVGNSSEDTRCTHELRVTTANRLSDPTR